MAERRKIHVLHTVLEDPSVLDSEDGVEAKLTVQIEVGHAGQIGFEVRDKAGRLWADVMLDLFDGRLKLVYYDEKTGVDEANPTVVTLVEDVLRINQG